MEYAMHVNRVPFSPRAGEKVREARMRGIRHPLRSATHAAIPSDMASSSSIEAESAGIAANTVTEALDELFAGFGSLVVAVIVAVFVTVVPAVAPLCRTRLNEAVAPLPNVPMVQLIVPVPLAGGVVQLNVGPVVWFNEAKVMFGGITSVSETLTASLGPLFATLMV